MDLKADSVWNITKSVSLVILLIFVWHYGNVVVDKFSFFRGSAEFDAVKESIVRIEENQIEFKNLISSDKQAKELVKRLEKKNGEQFELISRFKKEVKKKDAKLEEIGVIVATLRRTVEKLKTEASVAKTPPKTGNVEEDERRDKLAYEMKKIYGKDADGKDMLLAWAMYFPNQTPEKRWKVGTYPTEVHATVIESENVDGTFDRAIEVHVENNTQEETKGKEFPVEVEVEWEKFERNIKEFYGWNPRVGLGVTATTEDIAPNINFSVSSYGRTKRDLDWRFLTIGVGAAKDYNDDWKPVFSFEPVSWNLGTALPIINNLFVAPTITYGTEGNVGYGIGISIPF